MEINAQESGKTVDWLMENGVEFSGPWTTANFHGGPATNGVPRMHQLYPSAWEWPSIVQPKIEAAGGKVKLQTKGVELVVEGERVVGVKAVDQMSDEELYFRANKGVVLATNGPEAAKDYLIKMLSASLASLDPANTFNDGYGIRMAEKVGAASTGYIGPVSVAIRSQAPGPNIGSYGPLIGGGGIFVTSEGKRFASEDLDQYTTMAVQLNALPDRTGYIVFDDVVAQKLNEPPAYLSTMQEHGYGTVADFVEIGAIHVADTIEDVAQKARLDAATLAAEVAKYNEFVQTGIDEDFGRTKGFQPLSTPPYYIHGPQMPQYMSGNFSLNVTTKFEVKNTYGNVIPGLYAVGIMGHGLAAAMSTPGSHGGGNMSWAFTSGRLVGEQLASS
jgi:fumarate reductase flavoprotein subunit